MSGTAPYYAYGVINDQANSDGSLIPPILDSSLATGAIRLTLPVIVETGSFTTELMLTNLSTITKKVNFTFVSDAVSRPGNSVSFSRTLQQGRTGIWAESGVLDKFPEKGLPATWRTPLNRGFAGPAVATGRVFVTDFEQSAGTKGTERALCLDEKSGKILWTREWNVDYQGISYGTGPRGNADC